VKAEALAESTDWETAAAEIRHLQAEWKTIGPVKKTRSEAIWQRFRAACDHFFSRYAQRHDTAKGERVAARESIVAELEALVGPQDQAAPSEPAADLLANVRDIRRRWQTEIASRGVDRERAAALDDRFAAALQRVITQAPSVFKGTELDVDANGARMEGIVKRLEDLADSLAGPASGAGGGDAVVSPTTRLAAMLKEALAANTIGGKVDEDSRLRAAAEEVRQAQASFSRIGLVPDLRRRALADRLQRAIRRIGDRAAKLGSSGKSGGPGGPGGSGGSGRPGGSGRSGGSGGSGRAGGPGGSGRSGASGGSGESGRPLPPGPPGESGR
jgi:hypothetical protein